jgi:hypothetical protein
MGYLCSQRTPDVQIKYFRFDWSIYKIFVPNRWSILTLFNNDIRICLLDMKHSWNKNAFWELNNKKWRKWCKFVSPFFFNNTYGLPVPTKAPNVQIKYYMFNWLNYRIFVLNRGWKRVSLQINIFVYIWWTWGIVELKTRFETWIT